MQEKSTISLPKVAGSANSGSQCSARRRFTTACARIFFAGALLLPLINHAAEDNQSQLKNIQQDIAEKEKLVKQQRQQRISLLNQLEQQEKTIAKTGRRLHDTQEILTTLKTDISTLNTSIDKLQKQQTTQQKILTKQLDVAFRQGKNSALELILSGEENRRSERILAYFGYLNKARQQSIEQLKQTQTELTAQKSSLLTKLDQQQVLLNEQQTQRQKLEQIYNTRKKTLLALETSLEKNQQRLLELRQNETELRNKVALAEREAKARTEREAREAEKVREQVRSKELQAKKAGSSYKPSESERSLMARTGGLGKPDGQALWPVRGRIEHRFGEPLQGELRWKGMVIAANEGTEVKAIADGRILLADWLQGYGLVVVVEHGKGDMSLYGYNQSTLVNVGEKVRAGQPIALVGTSGGQGVPSLYFEIRRQGQTVNPQPWLRK